MNCKNSTNSVNQYYQLSGIDALTLEKTKNRMKMFLGMMEKIIIAEKKLNSIRGKKYSCIEDLLLQEGHFFDSSLELISPTFSLEKLFHLAEAQNRAYCEGFILPWTGGTPIQSEWVYDVTSNNVITREQGLHFGLAFNPFKLEERFPIVGQKNLLSYDMMHEKIFLDNGLSKDLLINNH